MKPRDCALLLAVPISRAELVAAAERAQPGGLGEQLREAVRLNGIDATWTAVRSQLELVADVAAEAGRLGVTVVANTTLDAWSTAITRFMVVTLVAHWRPPTVEPGDIADPESLRSELAASSTGLWRLLRTFDPDIAEPEDYSSATLARWLTDALAAGGPTSPTSPEAGLVEREHRIHGRRQTLEGLLPGVFRGGAAVEFADGPRSVPAMLDALDPSVRSVIDLTVCNSALLGEEIRRVCRHCLVMMNADRTSLAFRLALYRQALRLMRRNGRSYPDTMMRLREHVAGQA
jgi:hypothetical protein